MSPLSLRKRPPNGRHPQGLLAYLFERLRGREQRLLRTSDNLPLLLLSFPRGCHEAAGELEKAWLHTLPALPETVAGVYADMLRRLPGMTVVLLRKRNV